MRGRALLAVGRHDDDLAERREGLGQLANSFAVDAVVVGDEDAGHVWFQFILRREAAKDLAHMCAAPMGSRFFAVFAA